MGSSCRGRRNYHERKLRQSYFKAVNRSLLFVLYDGERERMFPFLLNEIRLKVNYSTVQTPQYGILRLGKF